MRRLPSVAITSVAVTAISMVIGASLLLAGCSQSRDTDYSSVAAQLQERVISVSVAAAKEDWQSASDDLDALEAEVATALARQELTPERAEAIRLAIDLVRTDVDAALDEIKKPTESPTPDGPSKGDDNKNDNGKKD